MARPRTDGSPSRQPIKRKLTDAFVSGVKPERQTNYYDAIQAGFVVSVQPTGRKTWKALYYAPGGRPRWYTIGDAAAIGLADARKIAAGIMLRAATGEDPVAMRKAERNRGTFEELATAYVDRHAKKKNKSWRQADALVRRFLLPKWGKLQAGTISRSDVKAAMAAIESPSMANQVIASGSAVFSWAIREEIVKANPFALIDRNETRDRDRILSNSEIPRFWPLLSPALRIVLLTGQRPGEVAHMRREHIKDGWWEMPGEPDDKLDWPGTKNAASHRVWLSASAREILDDLPGKGRVFGGGRVDNAMRDAMKAACLQLEAERATPHDLRRTFSTKVTGLGFGREAMNRVTNHKEGGIASVYDRHQYADENKRVMETVAANIMGLVEGKEDDNVVPIRA